MQPTTTQFPHLQRFRLPHVPDGLIVADTGECPHQNVPDVGVCSHQNRPVILSAARSAESKDLRFSSSHRRIR
jgi:hypothetical protein